MEQKPLGFGKTMFASMLGTLIVIAVSGMLFFFSMVGILASALSKDTSNIYVKEGSTLRIDLSAPIQEATPSGLSNLMAENKAIGLCDILKALEYAKTDSRIANIYLYFGAAPTASVATIEEIREAIIKFKEDCGKPVFAYGDGYSQSGYYLATVCDSIFLHPAGMVDFKGIGAETMFYKDLFDKLNIHMDLIRPKSNAYKSAGETYTMNHMSEANKEQIRAYISSIWNHLLTQISASRNIPVEKLNEYADNLTAYLAEDALRNGLVDRLCFEKEIQKAHKIKKFVNINSYASSIPPAKVQNDKIAIIYAEGNVVDGKGYGINVYGDIITKALDDAAEDKSVKAIVLRVNSPGGSATASETMTNAVIRAKKSKPVIVSMSDLAASAGYEISSNADYIVAQPTTITGSIGVFATLPEVGSMLKNKFGITFDTVQTNKNSTGLSLYRPRSAAALAMLQKNVEDFYITFTSRVATGRHLPQTFVDSIARGRVWTGIEAQKLGLVDTLGGMPLAMTIAAKKAGLKNYSVVEYPKQKDLSTEIMEMFTDPEARMAIKNKFGKNAVPEGTFQKELEYLFTMSPIQARLPYILNIQ